MDFRISHEYVTACRRNRQKPEWEQLLQYAKKKAARDGNHDAANKKPQTQHNANGGKNQVFREGGGNFVP